MIFMQTILSLLVGAAAGTIYGFSFMPQGLDFVPPEKIVLKEIRKKTFVSFFFFSTLRILLIGTLLYYILHTRTLNIILVVLAFLISFWFIIIKKNR
jgi:hypothetical protein